MYMSGNQNWMISQQKNGWMYFANNSGLLEFDGSQWNTYSIHNAKLRAVKVGSNGKIYVGGLGQFGYFFPNIRGELTYVCLSDSVVGHKVTNIWHIHTVENRVYFQDDSSLYCWDGKRITRINNAAGIAFSKVVYNKFYIAADGLFMLQGTDFVKLPGTEVLTKSRILELFPYDGKILVVTASHGLFLYDGIKAVPFPTVANSFIKENQLSCAAIHNSLLVLGSVQSGILLVDLKAGTEEHISIENGLQNKSILSIFFDREANLWLGLDKGIDYISLNSPLFFLFSRKSMIGSGYTSCCYRGKLYLGTNQGLYVTEIPDDLNKVQNIEFVPGTEGQVLSLFQYDDRLFCGGRDFFIIIDGDRVSHTNGRGVWGVSELGCDSDVLLVSTYWGLNILRKRGQEWFFSNKVKGGEFSAKTMFVEDNTNNVWIANKKNGLCRITLSDDQNFVVRKKEFNSTAFPPGDNVFVTKINNDVVVASHRGIFKYNHIKNCLERYTWLENLMNGKGSYTYLKQDIMGNIWYVNNGALKVLHYDQIKKKFYHNENEVYLSDFLIEDFENINFCCKDKMIVGTEDGFALLQFGKEMTKKYPLTLQIRKVYFSGTKDSLVYGRSYIYDDSPLIIPYKRNSIKIEYSANNYDQFQTVFYSYKLIGGNRNDSWSEYSRSRLKEYTDLYEGKYTFYVKIITDKDKEPVMTSFSFVVLPPWYRAWWAYGVYILLFMLCIGYLYYKIRESRKKIIWQKEEEITKQRTHFEKERELKDRTIDSLKEENLLSELKYKSEELVRSTLNLVRKNEVLQSIRKDAMVINHSISEENLVSIRRKILRLINQIDANMEHDNDLKNFQITFDSVHHNFFKRLDELFPDLNNRDKMLCAYIKMDLMSKEIAPLLNISVRGVEISRYRLRKKLHLEEKDNLADFLQKLSD